MKKISLFTAVFLLASIPSFSYGADYKLGIPDFQQKFNNQPVIPNPPSPPPSVSSPPASSHAFGVDNQGNTSTLAPNNSGGYSGFDSRGNPVTITPLRGQLGVDSQGNIWTIRPR
jgi:hypothetical protein